jgi:protein Hikeshi
VLLLPGIALPAGAAAAIYLATAANPSSFRFLGAIGPGKESAIFNVKHAGTGAGDGGGLVIGVEVESEEAVAQRMQELAASKSTTSNSTSGQQQPSTVVLAQRIIQNAFNFLTSFSGTAGPGGVEVVPLKAFEDWWRKFESRVRADPSFLEKQTG